MPLTKINILIHLKSIPTIKISKEEIHTISKQDIKIVDISKDSLLFCIKQNINSFNTRN